MLKQVIIATGNIDSHGDILQLEGLMHRGKCLVTLDFDMHNVVGRAHNIEIEGNELKADIELFPENEQSILSQKEKLWPAITFTLYKSEVNDQKQRVIKDFKLMSVGLCRHPNADPNVPPINP